MASRVLATRSRSPWEVVSITTLLERTLSANVDAERFVLGSILLNHDRYVEGVLASDDFSLEKHRRIFARMRDLYDRGENIDRITVAEELQKHGQLESVDGLSYVVSLDDGLPEIVNLESYIRIVKEKATLRQTMFACQKIIDQCAQAVEPSEEILQTAETLLASIGSRNAALGSDNDPHRSQSRLAPLVLKTLPHLKIFTAHLFGTIPSIGYD